jgi:MFS transporter, DHA1 family, multidrug resistance protein
MMLPSARLGSLHLQRSQRNLYTIVLAQTVGMIGFGIAQPFLPFYLQELGIDSVERVAFWVGLISSMQPICMAVSAPIWGIVADRYGRKPMLVRAMIGGGVVFALAGLATSAEQLAALRIIGGIFTGTVAASTTLVAVTTPREQAGYGLGLLQTAIFSGNFLGPLIGGIIGSTLGYRAAFAISGVLLIVTGVLVGAIVQENFVRPAARQHKGNPLVATLRDLARDRIVFTMILLLMFNNLSVNVTMPVLPLFVQSLIPNADQAAATTGVILGVTALANAVAAVWVGRSADRLGRRRVLIVCLLMGALSYLPQGLTRFPWQLLALRIFTGFSMGGITPATNAVIAESAPKGGEGGVYGVSASLNAFGRAIGPMIGAVVVTSWGVAGVFPVTGALLLVVAMLVLTRTQSMTALDR